MKLHCSQATIFLLLEPIAFPDTLFNLVCGAVAFVVLNEASFGGLVILRHRGEVSGGDGGLSCLDRLGDKLILDEIPYTSLNKRH
jgi:hypothetical protein